MPVRGGSETVAWYRENAWREAAAESAYRGRVKSPVGRAGLSRAAALTLRRVWRPRA